MTRATWNDWIRKLADRRGAVSVIFALMSIPLMLITGISVDFARILQEAAKLQNALDAATLAAAAAPSSSRDSIAMATITASLQGTDIQSSLSVQFSAGVSAYSGTATVAVPTAFMSMFRVNTVAVKRQSAAVYAVYETACVQSYGAGQQVSEYSMTFNGTPSLNLSGCSLRSNTSAKCNGGNNGLAAATIAAGQAVSCNNPQNGVNPPMNIYSSMASKITKVCNNTKLSSTWTNSQQPNGARLVTVQNTNYTEYHVCGDVTFSGTGSLQGLSSTQDNVIIVEDGSITMATGANISLSRTAIVLTGTNSSSIKHILDFPNGNGNSAQLTITPPTTDGGDWEGVSLYLDPALTTNVSMTWNSGASLKADGLVYLGSSDMTISGTVVGAGGGCTKLAVNTLTLNGNIQLQQADNACTTVGMKRATSSIYLSY